jgi:hypothetical protein
MSQDDIRDHIRRAARRGTPVGQGISVRIIEACWPGGPADRTEPVALLWVSRWRPLASGTSLPACTCATGRCLVCN